MKGDFFPLVKVFSLLSLSFCVYIHGNIFLANHANCVNTFITHRLMNRKISLQYVSMQFRLRILMNYEHCSHTNTYLEVNLSLLFYSLCKVAINE